MEATKKQTNRKGTGRSSSGRKNTKKKTTAKQSVTSGFQTEIILLIILAASIILIFSNLGMGGTVGATISAAFWCDGYPCVSVSESDLRMCGISGFEPQESTGIQKGACGTAVLYLSVWTDPASDGRIYAKYDTG